MNRQKKLFRLILALFLALLLVGCDDGVYSGTLIFEGSHTFGPETSLPGDVLLRAGTAEFTAGSQVSGTVYVVGANCWRTAALTAIWLCWMVQ